MQKQKKETQTIPLFHADFTTETIRHQSLWRRLKVERALVVEGVAVGHVAAMKCRLLERWIDGVEMLQDGLTMINKGVVFCFMSQSIRF